VALSGLLWGSGGAVASKYLIGLRGDTAQRTASAGIAGAILVPGLLLVDEEYDDGDANREQGYQDTGAGNQ
jgi:hypothetical protein